MQRPLKLSLCKKFIKLLDNKRHFKLYKPLKISLFKYFILLSFKSNLCSPINPSKAEFSINCILLFRKFNLFKLFKPLKVSLYKCVILFSSKVNNESLFKEPNVLGSIDSILLLDKSISCKLSKPLELPMFIIGNGTFFDAFTWFTKLIKSLLSIITASVFLFNFSVFLLFL